jgi:hypothetical protein
MRKNSIQPENFRKPNTKYDECCYLKIRFKTAK